MLTSGMQEAQDWENWELWESSELLDRELSSDTGPFLSAKKSIDIFHGYANLTNPLQKMNGR